MFKTTGRTALITSLAVGAITAGTLAVAQGAHAAPDPVYVTLQTSQNGATSNRVTLGSFTYQLRLDHSGVDYTTISLVVTAKRGVTGDINGQYRDSNYIRTDQTPNPFSARISPSATFSNTASANSFKLRFVKFDDKLHVTGSDGTRQTVTGSLAADARASAGNRGVASFSIEPGA